MPDIKIVTEVAGRVCALPVEIGGKLGDGDDIAFVEAMKMEIPVASPAAGKLKSLLIAIDDVVAEGSSPLTANAQIFSLPCQKLGHVGFGLERCDVTSQVKLSQFGIPHEQDAIGAGSACRQLGRLHAAVAAVSLRLPYRLCVRP
jgi:hypothetical protein